MTINEFRYLFANEVSDEYGVFMCTIGSDNSSSNDEETNIITSKTPFKETWDFHYLEDSAPLQFPITIAKQDGTYFDANEERSIKKWMCKKQREWLQIDQEDLSDVFYYCILTNPQKVDVGRRSAGLQFSVNCDCGHAWSGLKTKRYSTVGGTLTFNFNNIVDYDDYILSPTIIITPTVNGTVNITNTTTNESIIITNCVTTETITISCKTDKIKSSSDRIMLNDWNKNTISLREGNNSLVLTGNFQMEMQYRLPVRVGG